MALIPESYRRKHGRTQLEILKTDTAKQNQGTLDGLRFVIKRHSDVDLLSAFPINYTRRRKIAIQNSAIPITPKEVRKLSGPPDFHVLLDNANNASIVYLLSDDVTAMLTCLAGPSDGSKNPEQSLILRLEQLICNSPKLWESHIRGVVAKCNEQIIVKVTDHRGMTEYTKMQYHAEHAPDIPAPEPHGLVRFGHYMAIFMFYIPSIMLTKAWPTTLSHKQKLSVQCRLDGIFSKLRTLRKEVGNVLGGTDGEGVKDYHLGDTPHKDCIYTAADFDDLHFSVPHYGVTKYTKFFSAPF